MAQVYSQAYGYKFYFVPLLKSAINFASLDLGGLGSGKFIDDSTLLSNDADVIKQGTTSTLKLFVGGTKSITNAVLSSNVVTLTVGASHGYQVGDVVVVAGLTGDFSGINGTFTLTAVASTTISYAKTATNIASAATSAGTVTGGLLKLDGTDKPIRLLGLTNAAPSETEKEETIMTYDDEVKSFETSVATGKGFSWKLEGVTDHNDAAYQLLRICAKESVREGLMIKYARLGPTGHSETTYGYGRFTGFDETPPAGGIVKWSSGIKAYGPYELDF
jgi:hypothetical protein